ncbi:MAG: molybdenum cofactor guanylyltransferase [bacterium]|nr:molybdenum cofactor guanylyltransferase [bacterium]
MSLTVGVALAGGASRRMGGDKARLRLADESLVASTARRLSAVCAEVLVADRGRGILEGALSVDDGPGAGPVAGILGAAAARPGRELLVLACDLPRVPEALLAALVDAGAGDWVVPRWARGIEPLCALYRPGALAALAERVRDGRYAVHGLQGVVDLAIRTLDEEALMTFGEPRRLFFNLNTPADLECL